MATVKIQFNADASNVEKYLINKKEVEGPTTEQSCKLEGMTKIFSGIQNSYDSPGNNAIHIIQSWSPKESKQLTREQVHEMGINLVERFAPGHQFVVQTHTDQDHSHNHIVLNPVSIETGERIQNKKHHLGTLRDLNDAIALEHGMSVLPKQEIGRRSPGVSDKVKRIDNYRGRSYIMDLANKANFSRQLATNYDEYVAVLNSFDIQARIEPKNITYFYPGREHGKRGKNLRDDLDKPGLEKKFQSNLEKYAQSPELRKDLTELVKEFRSGPSTIPDQGNSATKAAALVSPRSEKVTTPRLDELAKTLIPIEEIQKAKTQSILRYCEKEGIKISTNSEGRKLLTGRDYVEVSDHSWTNHKNKTRGNLIDFVANHQEIGFLHAVAKINNNPKLLLLEQYLGESRKSYQSFHVPKEDAAPRVEGIAQLVKLLGHPSSNRIYAELFKQQRVHVCKNGSILFFSAKSQDGYVEYSPRARGEFQRLKKGHLTALFAEPPMKSTEIHLFLEPKQLLKSAPQSLTEKTRYSVAALLEPSLELVHQMVAKQPQLRKLTLIPGEDDRGSPGILTFYQELKKSLDPFSIETELMWGPLPHKNHPRSQDLDLGVSLER